MKKLLSFGTRSCAGCPASLAVRRILEAVGDNVIVVNGTSCLEVTTTQYPLSSWNVPYIHTAFECTGAVASGVESALKKMGKDTHVVAIAGDGGTFDIGLQSLSGMIDRGHNVLYICYDNECYANTGLQRSSATPYGAATTTSPPGKFSIGNKTFKKPIVQMLAAQKVPYVATASLAYPDDIERKVKKALTIKGPKFIHILAPCPISWRFDSSETIRVARLAVETGMWILCEIENGKIKINVTPSERKPVKDYLSLQGRFKHLKDEDIKKIQEKVDDDWKAYKKY